MKKVLSIIGVLSILFVIAACGSNQVRLSLGNYSQEDGVLRLTVEKEQIFTFTNTLLSSWPATGNFVIENGKLILLTENNKYVFEISNNTLIFIKSASSLNELEQYSGFDQLEDGMIFTMSTD